ncbi:transcription initiation factor TFIID subunit [Tieghemostelium lacteum]|uniref:Transcription initiation factor TFIID subunit n=1 Tax=Tieghemostelium lacteum TaxID=361077 RepID=A0A151ZB40_TIELA|nr:transcription initiation factor TFIID subunit [Tieghemostelium lacteum]|eukprot:KYQ91151.1 transcription initiation factor TFIID subunit [Tieghemostelium lacteum]
MCLVCEQCIVSNHKDHTMSSLNNLYDQMCPNHPCTKLSLYCHSNQCQKFICYDCVIDKHCKHSIGPIPLIILEKSALNQYFDNQTQVDSQRLQAFGIKNTIQTILEPNKHFEKTLAEVPEKSLPEIFIEKMKLAMYYINSKEYHNYPNALRLLRECSNQGSTESMWCLSMIYETGNGIIGRDLKKFYKWLNRAAEYGHLASQFRLAQIHLFGSSNTSECSDSIPPGLQLEKLTGYQWANTCSQNPAAGRGHGHLLLALAHIRAVGVPQNHHKSLVHLREAIKHKIPMADYFMGIAYKEGYQEENHQKAMIHFINGTKYSSDSDDTNTNYKYTCIKDYEIMASCHFEIAQYYHRGKDFPKDLVKALRHYSESIKLNPNHWESVLAIGEIHLLENDDESQCITNDLSIAKLCFFSIFHAEEKSHAFYPIKDQAIQYLRILKESKIYMKNTKTIVNAPLPLSQKTVLQKPVVVESKEPKQEVKVIKELPLPIPLHRQRSQTISTPRSTPPTQPKPLPPTPSIKEDLEKFQKQQQLQQNSPSTPSSISSTPRSLSSNHSASSSVSTSPNCVSLSSSPLQLASPKLTSVPRSQTTPPKPQYNPSTNSTPPILSAFGNTASSSLRRNTISYEQPIKFPLPNINFFIKDGSFEMPPQYKLTTADEQFKKAIEFLDSSSNNTTKETEKAMKEATKVATKLITTHNHAPSYCFLAYNQMRLGSGKSSINVFEYLKIAAESHHPRACFLLSTCYSSGTYTKNNRSLALKWANNSAYLGYIEGFYQVAKELCEIGEKTESISWFLKFISLTKDTRRSDKAKSELANLYSDLGDHRSSLNYHKDIVASGNLSTPSTLNLADYLYYGYACEINYKSALDLYMKAGEHSSEVNDSAKAYQMVALIHLRGNSVGQDIQTAKTYFDKSAKLGDKDSQSYSIEVHNCLKNLTKQTVNALVESINRQDSLDDKLRAAKKINQSM